MNSEMKQRLVGLTAQLAETLMAAAIQTDEIRMILQMEVDSAAAVQRGRLPNAQLSIHVCARLSTARRYRYSGREKPAL